MIRIYSSQADLEAALDAKLSLSSWYATTTSALVEGSNLYFTNARVQSFVQGSTTIPKTYTSNTFTLGNTFNGTLTVGDIRTVMWIHSGTVYVGGDSVGPNGGIGKLIVNTG